MLSKAQTRYLLAVLWILTLLVLLQIHLYMLEIHSVQYMVSVEILQPQSELAGLQAARRPPDTPYRYTAIHRGDYISTTADNDTPVQPVRIHRLKKRKPPDRNGKSNVSSMPSLSIDHGGEKSLSFLEKENSTGNYLLALTFVEQLSMATSSMLKLAPLAVDWNARLVEPIVLNSQLFGVNGLYPDRTLTPLQITTSPDAQQSIRLSQVYSIKSINSLLHSQLSERVSMVRLEEFVSTAPRDVVLLHFITPSYRLNDFSLPESDARLVMRASRVRGMIECTNLLSAKVLAQRVENHLNATLSNASSTPEGFQVAKILCLNYTSVITSLELLKHIPLPATIIFTAWTGCGLRDCSLSHHKGNTSQISNTSPFRFSAILTEAVFQPSLRIETFHALHHPSIGQTARAYLEHIGIKSPFLAVHIRTEKIIKDGIRAKIENYTSCCIDHLHSLLASLQKTNSHQRLLLVSDTGSLYGTGACGYTSKLCTVSDIASIASKLTSFNITLTSYDPKVFNTTENSGVVSLVEMHMLAMGEKLILVGRGGFQAMLKNLFLSASGHQRGDVYHVCSTDQPRVNYELCTSVT